MSSPFLLDAARCVRCGACVEDCVAGVLKSTPDGPIMQTPEDCMNCFHCLAVCPKAAISIHGRAPGDAPPAHPLPTPEAFARLARYRRSARVFLPNDVPPETLRRIVDTAWQAPTGVNARGLFFAVLATRTAMDRFRHNLYARLDDALSRPGKEPGEHDETLMELLADWRGGTDVIFRNAPHMVVACAGPQAFCRDADPFIALAYLELAAAAEGVGALWCGLAAMALAAADGQALLEELGVPADYTPSYAMMLGMPKYIYARGVDRGPANAVFVT